MKNLSVNLPELTEEQQNELFALLASFAESKKEIKTPFDITKEIKPREKAAFIKKAKETEKEDLFSLAKDFIRSVYPSLSERAQKALKDKAMLKAVAKNLFAVAVSAHEIAKANDLFEYFAKYAKAKATATLVYNDFGAVADLIETCVHCVACRELWRVKLSNLHVSDIGKIDVTINRIKFEVGTNGKTFAESSPVNFVAGKYTGLIYGVFTEEEKERLCKYFMKGKTFAGLTFACERLFVWEDKNAFIPFCESLCKRSALEWNDREKYARFRYSESTDKAFRNAVKNQKVVSLADYMRGLSVNDFLLSDMTEEEEEEM